MPQPGRMSSRRALPPGRRGRQTPRVEGVIGDAVMLFESGEPPASAAVPRSQQARDDLGPLRSEPVQGERVRADVALHVERSHTGYGARSSQFARLISR